MSLIAELKRRNVFRVGVAYGIVAWLLIEVTHTAFPTLQLPSHCRRFSGNDSQPAVARCQGCDTLIVISVAVGGAGVHY